MNLQQMLDIIERQSGQQLNDDQKKVVIHGAEPLWVIAGPGSGKTEVLVLRCLKLICVDLVPPKSVILTTFTDKAAKNIQDRIAVYKSYLDKEDSSVRSIDASQLRAGTLHSICNDVMQECRYAEYQNYRLLDEIDQLLFVYEHAPIAASKPSESIYLPLWQHFHYLVSGWSKVVGYKWSPSKTYLPHRWLRADAAVDLFNRIVEDRIDINRMRRQGGVWETLADEYATYRDNLETHLRCDFAHLQLKFLNFLASPSGAYFLDGDGTSEQPGIQHILVDEYQDTNPFQEEIYLQLARRVPHNLCVVGDDDQALYRFRGGTVECMVNFDQACYRAWGQNVLVHRQPLSTNYRSHPKIIEWCDNFIRSFSVMGSPGARVAYKPNLKADPDWRTNRQAKGAIVRSYPHVSFLIGKTENDLAECFADLVRGLLSNGIVQDPSQCVLLIKSTRNATHYQDALQLRGIRVYNPRSRTFLEQEEIQSALGALVTILDPNQVALSSIKGKNPGIRDIISSWVDAYRQIALTHVPLANYTDQSINRIRQTPANQKVTQMAGQNDTSLPANMQEIFYHLISFEPFTTWQQDPERTYRLGLLSRVFEAYCTLPFTGRPGSTRGTLSADKTSAGVVHSLQLNHFYNALVGLLVSKGLNDPEDEEVICPPGMFPIMTVHQAKGLEFPFVFVAKPGIQEPPAGKELQLEDELKKFRVNPALSTFSMQEKAEQDYIRFFYVAYSRPEYALVLLSTAQELRGQGLGFGGYGRPWFEKQVLRIPK